MYQLHIRPGIISLFVWLFLLSSVVLGQLNVEAGYSYSFMDPSAVNAVLSSYESDRAGRSGSLADTKGLHGLELAGIYHFDRIAVGAFGAIKRDRNKSEYNATDGTGNLEELVIHSQSLLGLVLQSNIEQFAIGTRLGYNFYKLKFKGNAEFPDRTIDFDGGLAVQFYLSYYLRGNDNLRLLFRPYYQLNLYKNDNAILASELAVDAISAERLHSFGLSLIFVNGPFHQ